MLNSSEEAAGPRRHRPTRRTGGGRRGSSGFEFNVRTLCSLHRLPPSSSGENFPPAGHGSSPAGSHTGRGKREEERRKRDATAENHRQLPGKHRAAPEGCAVPHTPSPAGAPGLRSRLPAPRDGLGNPGGGAAAEGPFGGSWLRGCGWAKRTHPVPRGPARSLVPQARS